MNGIVAGADRILYSFSLALCAASCRPPTDGQAPVVRSPTLDYQQPATTTASGRSLASDRVAPSDKLEQGPQVGSESKPGPGWSVDSKGLFYDETRRGDKNASVKSEASKKGSGKP